MSGPDFSHAGRMFDWTNAEMDERFADLIAQARENIGRNVELFRYSLDQPEAPQIKSWWSKQQSAIRTHVGTVLSLKLVAGCRMDKELGEKVGYVRFDPVKPRRAKAAA